MKDIAQELGVSTALVSYVMNNKFTDRINADTAKKIKELAASLNYTPNHIAKSLKKNKTFTIGLIIADISNLFYSNIARFIEDEAEKNNYNVIFGSADESPYKFKGLLDIFLGRQVDGIILAAPANTEHNIKYLRDQGMPFVLIDRIFPRIKGVNSVMIDNYRASYEVVQHLAEKKFERPVMITLASKLYHLQERSRGYIEALQSVMQTQETKVFDVKEEELSEKIEGIILGLLNTSSNIDSVYFSTNKIAMEGLAVIAKHRIKVPEQLGVVCFDEADAYRIFNTSITYVKQPLRQIGNEAVRLLLSKIKGVQIMKNEILNTEIIEGSSTSKHFNKS